MANESSVFVEFRVKNVASELETFLKSVDEASGRRYSPLAVVHGVATNGAGVFSGEAIGKWDYSLNLENYFSASENAYPDWVEPAEYAAWDTLRSALVETGDVIVVSFDESLETAENGEYDEVVFHISAKAGAIVVSEISRVTPETCF